MDGWSEAIGVVRGEGEELSARSATAVLPLTIAETQIPEPPANAVVFRSFRGGFEMVMVRANARKGVCSLLRTVSGSLLSFPENDFAHTFNDAAQPVVLR